MIRGVALLAMTGLSGLAGCSAIRPVDDKRPTAPTTFIADGDAASGSGGASEVARPKPGASARATEGEVWWSAFADPALDKAIQEALRNNYFIRDVRTLISENALDPAVPWSLWWPLEIGISNATPAGIQHVTVGNPPLGDGDPTQVDYTSANIGVTASYQVDLWGNLYARRRVAKDLVEQQRQSTEIAAQNVAEQVAQLWFDVLAQRALKELTEREVQYNQELLDLVKARFEQHMVTRLAVLQQEQQLLSVRSQVPLITAQISLLNSQLTAVLGRLPTPHGDLVPADRRLPDLPASPDLGKPDDLNANTPEMRFAMRRVTEIEHRVNQHLSSWLPVVEVLGSTGMVSYNWSDPIRESFVGVRLSWALFDGGRRILEGKVLDLTLKRRQWQQDLALKSAVGRVQDALLRERSQAESLRSLRAQVELGKQLLEEARQLFMRGGSDYLPVVTALANLAALERDALRAQRLLLSHRVQLYRALGGTWSRAVTELRE